MKKNTGGCNADPDELEKILFPGSSSSLPVEACARKHAKLLTITAAACTQESSVGCIYWKGKPLHIRIIALTHILCSDAPGCVPRWHGSPVPRR